MSTARRWPITHPEVPQEVEHPLDERLNAAAIGAHHVKTSLSAAAAWAELLAQAPESLNAEARQRAAEQILSLITRAIDDIHRSIEGISERASPAMQNGSFTDVGEALALSIRAFDPSDDGRITWQASESLIAACPPLVYRQVVDQLLENAIKYSRPGERIVVETRSEGNDVVTSIRDRGIGLPEGVDIFAAYVRGTDPNAPPGSGLGLHIVKTLTERYGGSAIARRDSDAGSIFEVRFPVGDPDG
jgi:signal transduction histidine kinase